MSEFSRKAYVARTSHDQMHLNRLSIPEWGVVEVRIKKGAAGSLSYRLPGASTPRAPTGAGNDNFNFAPGPQYDPTKWTPDPSRTDRVKIWYDLHNPFLNITKAKLQLFRRFDDDPIWERELTDYDLHEGEHEVEFEFDYAAGARRKDWDGSIDSSKRFPDGFLTVEHSPYKLRLIAEGPARSSANMAWTHFHVLIHHLELEWGLKNAIPSSDKERRQPFLDMLNPTSGPAPTPTTTKIPIELESPIFKTSGGEMVDNTLYKKYKSMWGQGPEIPLFCKIWIRDSSGAAVVAPKAIGKTKFLWDWESRSGPLGQAFVDDAQKYDVNATQPPGQNCHDDRGGKRGSSKAVFPEQSGYDPRRDLKGDDFPFKVEQCDDPRAWAAYSYAWTKESLGGKTGVLFQPSRMAGDKFRVTVYAAHETFNGKEPRLQVAMQAPLLIDHSLVAQTGDFIIWRRVALIKVVKKTTGVTNLSFPTIAGFYLPAFLDLVDKSVTPDIYPGPEWNTNLKDAITDWSSKEQLIVDPAVDQYASGDNGVHIRTSAQFQSALMTKESISAADAGTWMANNAMGTNVAYAKTAEGLCKLALIKVFDKRFRSDIPGVNIHQTAMTHNLQPSLAATGLVDGRAEDYPSADRNHCGFMSYVDPTQNAAMSLATSAEMTAAHEFGHHFFLPHSRDFTGETGYDAHDLNVTTCLMSYNPAKTVFCGLCQLRLRGWDKSEIKPGGNNHKP